MISMRRLRSSQIKAQSTDTLIFSITLDSVGHEEIAPYYRSRNYTLLIEKGVLVLVNAVAYRSPKITKEPRNLRVAELLPSTTVHRNWLRTELLPQAIWVTGSSLLTEQSFGS